jgi:hypothetical protein
MTPEAKEALEKCIEKYDRASKGKSISLGPSSCALCKIFHSFYGCDGCPVKERTGLDYCENTPYLNIAWTMAKHHHSSGFYKDAARQERDFLISLRED